MESESQTPGESLEKFTEQDIGVLLSKDELLFPLCNQSWGVSLGHVETRKTQSHPVWASQSFWEGLL